MLLLTSAKTELASNIQCLQCPRRFQDPRTEGFFSRRYATHRLRWTTSREQPVAPHGCAMLVLSFVSGEANPGELASERGTFDVAPILKPAFGSGNRHKS